MYIIFKFVTIYGKEGGEREGRRRERERLALEEQVMQTLNRCCLWAGEIDGQETGSEE